MTRAEFGIEKVGIYPGSRFLPISVLAEARGLDAAELERDLMVRERSVFAVWEDPVAMAVNAADPLLTEGDRRATGLLIVATETSVDQEKTLSSWVHEGLGLPEDCRNFEIKHACMGMTDGIRMALAWLESAGRGRKALVVSADRSLIGLNEQWEPVNGGAAAAVLLSAQPSVLRYEGASGIYTENVTDVIRPTPRLETTNSQESLFSYLQALDGSLGRYVDLTPKAKEYDSYFAAHIYHSPFPGITRIAHRSVIENLYGGLRHDFSKATFEQKVLPALEYNRRVGTSFGSSTLIALTCLLQRTSLTAAGDRVSFYAYGAGSCGEFFSGIIGDAAVPNAHGSLLDADLDARRPVSFEEYEALERANDASVGARNLDIDIDDSSPRPGRTRLYVLTGIKNYVRSYAWTSR